MKLIKGIYILIPGTNTWDYVDVEQWGRVNGHKTLIIRYDNKRITPLEQRLKGWNLQMGSWYHRIYSGPSMAEMHKKQYGENNLYKLIKS